MLNFLENRRDEAKGSITGINRKPHIAFGMSVESPVQFVKDYTTINTDTYTNPHLKYEQLRLSKMSFHQRSKLNSDWTKKTNINLIEEDKVVNRQQNAKNRSLYHDLYKQQLEKSTSRFRLTKGQFTSFIHNQSKNQILGPLEGQQRTLQRANQTRKSIMQQSITNLSKFKNNQSSFSINRISTLYDEKRKLRKNRQKLHNSIKMQIENRRYQKSPSFLLPKVLRQPKERKSAEKDQKQKNLFQDYLNLYFKTIDVPIKH